MGGDPHDDLPHAGLPRKNFLDAAAEADLVQIIGELKKTYRVARIFLCGGSMGGTASLTFAALHPNSWMEWRR